MRLIDADALKATLSNEPNYIDDGAIFEQFEKTIDNAPTIIWCNQTSEGLPLFDLRERPDVIYLCKYHKEPHCCKHTHRIEDALNFEEVSSGKWMEKERPQGEWIEDYMLMQYVCSECGNIPTICTGAGLSKVQLDKYYHFCRHCGAKMDMRGDAE